MTIWTSYIHIHLCNERQLILNKISGPRGHIREMLKLNHFLIILLLKQWTVPLMCVQTIPSPYLCQRIIKIPHVPSPSPPLTYHYELWYWYFTDSLTTKGLWRQWIFDWIQNANNIFQQFNKKGLPSPLPFINAIKTLCFIYSLTTTRL